MAQSAAPGLPLPSAAPLHDWGCCGAPDPEGYSSSSPAPSPDSCGLSSPAAARGPSRGPAAPRLRGGTGGRKGLRGAGGPRQSASEREKLRMRRLAQALLRLRHYLPPALAPAGQSLTKVETLRLAARYIGHLSALLGLGPEALARRRGAPARRCPLCPQGLGCCQAPLAPPLASPPAAAGRWRSPALSGSPALWGSPAELPGAAGLGPGAWESARCVPAAGTPAEVLDVADMGVEVWGSPHYIPATGTLPELHGVDAPNATSWLSPPHCTAAGTPPDLPGDPLLDAGLMLPEFVDAGAVTQDLSADLISLLEALLPPQPQD